MTPLPPYEHLDPDPLHVEEETPAWLLENNRLFLEKYGRGRYPDRKPGIPRAVIGWLLVSLAVVLLIAVSVALFLRGFGA